MSLGASIARWSAVKDASGEVAVVPLGDPQYFLQIGLIKRSKGFITISLASVVTLDFHGRCLAQRTQPAK